MSRRKESESNSWELLPSSLADVETIRKYCRRLVLRRAAFSAGVSALPIPGLDIAADLSFLASVINDINIEFGLSPDQIMRLQPKMRLIAYEMMVGMGGVLIGKVVTREVVAQLLKRSGLKMLTRYTAKIVPIAGQIVSASIGFATFRAVANQHIDACAITVTKMLTQIDA
jgi:hypothetical protein